MKKLLTGLLAFSMLLSCDLAQGGGKGGGSSSGGSKSYSGSSSGGSKSYSGSGSSSKPASSGKSYTGSSPGSGTKSYTGNSGSSSGSSKPAASGSGTKSYGGAVAKPSVAVAPKPVSGSEGKTYSSGNKTYEPVTSNPSGSVKPKNGAFDGNAAQAKQREESKANYIKGAEPKSTYVTPTGKTAAINPTNGSTTTIHNMSHNTYITRETRIYGAYSPYYGRPVVFYSDPYNSFFWWWLLDRSLDERAMWAYHHQNEMDSARYRELCAKDAQLDARVRQLEAQNKGVRDTSFTPKGIDPDLQYTDDFVDSVYNPHVEHDNTPDAESGSGFWHGVGVVLYYIFMTLLILSVIAVIVWLIFIHSW
jgi:hypothetical protein